MRTEFLRRDVVLRIIRYLPARTEGEITSLLKLAQDMQDEQVYSACAQALRRSRPQNDEARAALRVAQTSGLGMIEEAAQWRLEQRF
jgi:hypothetical protein